MFPANHYVIRPAADADAPAVRRLAELDSRAPLTGRVLVGEIDDAPAVAISLDDGRIVADPFQPTSQLVVLMGIRARALRSYEAVPSLAERIADSLAPARRHTIRAAA